MSQLACPLCGRFVSLNGFDPSNFESDIYAVNRTGLGRGKGFSVGPSFSVLGDLTITGPIASRCRKILGLIEGRQIPSSKDVSVLTKEIEKWKGEALREQRDKEEVFAQLADVESQALFLKKEGLTLRKMLNENGAGLAGLEDEVNRWRHMVIGLQEENRRLESLLRSEDDLDEEGEMQVLLDAINASTNGEFIFLSEAIEFLLEGI
jgi:hypothetical protein